MKKYEYKLLTVSVAHLRKEDFQAELNTKFQEWGNEGWDLVKMEPITTGNMAFRGATTREFLVVFKRKKKRRG
jgi:hypothetical protein